MTLLPTTAGFPFCATSPSGMRVEWNANGSIRRMDCDDVMLNLFLGNDVEGGPANIYLRCLGEAKESVPLVGPGSPATYRFDKQGLAANGRWRNLIFRLRFVLAESATAWFWHVELENTGKDTVSCDLIHTQDVALAHYGAVRLNEYYVSHYVDHTPIEHPLTGVAVASRQNQPMGGRCPWTVIGSLGRGVSYSTDALQFNGLACRSGHSPAALTTGLAGKRLQHEHSLVAIQDKPLLLLPGTKACRGYFGWFQADKPTPTSAADTSIIDRALSLPEATSPEWPSEKPENSCPPANLFASSSLLDTLELDEAEMTALFGPFRRHAEYFKGQLLSFFSGDSCHVVLKAKEQFVLRPHGLILRTGSALTPDESSLTSTVWMSGVFHSMVTQGHVSINRLLSTCHSYLGLFRSHGQRVFVEVDGVWRLLGIPSAFAMTPACCRWCYKHRDGLIEVVSSASDDKHELRLSLSVLKGNPAKFLVSHHIAINGDDGSSDAPVLLEKNGTSVFVRAVPDSDIGRRFPKGGFVFEPTEETRVETLGGDELLYTDGVSRRQPFICLITETSTTVELVIRGRLVEAHPLPEDVFLKNIDAGLRISAPASSPLELAAGRTEDYFPWLIQNALVHYLSPRGLEQYSGGGWGTRDVCQGPVELMLALGRFEPIRDLLVRVFRQQNSDGDWPQWFMFFDRERHIRPGDSHGDIVYWPLLALAQYLSATGDTSLLDEPLPFFHPAGDASAEIASVVQHVDRALALISRRVIDGTALAAYGHGDWNDSLQPAKPDMRDRLCSSWTVTLNYQTFVALAAAFRRFGIADRATRLENEAARILKDFKRLLIVDDVLAGLAYFHEEGNTDYLLHPRDGFTGLSYSLLPMIHAIINDMFSPALAKAHLGLIRDHLLGPDGAHLFDRPMAYGGGLQTFFQRAESASYFGREIGLMYTHAHLRYCEALARYGDADNFFRALCQANPITIQELIPSAARRQSNCYFSSSDPAFSDRYEAYEHYDRVRRGEVALEGGWRVYSSGAGICVRLIMQCFLGLRQEQAALVVDPVIPPTLDGLAVSLRLAGHRFEVTYHIRAKGCGPVSVSLNGEPLAFNRERNPYRSGAIRIAMDALSGMLSETVNDLAIRIE